MTDDSPKLDQALAIHVAGKSSNIRVGQIHVEGEPDLIEVEDVLSDVSFGSIRHTLANSTDRDAKR